MDIRFEPFSDEIVIYLKNKLLEALPKFESKLLRGLIVLSEDSKFVDIITEGDIRRSLIKGLKLDSEILDVVNMKNQKPITISKDADSNEIISILQKYSIDHLPIVDSDNNVLGLVYGGSIGKSPENVTVLIMAGGFGKRLGDLTKNSPKPLLEIGGESLINNAISNACKHGFKKFIISVHYLADQIIEAIGDGSKQGIEVSYYIEEKPLGTAGCIKYLDITTDHLLITNSDLYGLLPFIELYSFHLLEKNDFTSAVKSHAIKNPFGVVKIKDGLISEIVEKPTWETFINTGMYVMGPKAINFAKNNNYLMMDELINALVDNSQRVTPFALHEDWIDVGDINALNKAKLKYYGKN